MCQAKTRRLKIYFFMTKNVLCKVNKVLNNLTFFGF